MHFVKRTPANEAYEEKEARKLSEKLKAYVELNNQIFTKRDKGEFDDELLSLTAEALKKNPDIYTFWGIRRQVVQVKINQVSAKESIEREQNPEDKLVKIFNEELSVTKEGIMKNPKSYGAWHHRYWTCKNHPKLDFKKELGLCEKALSMDPRNFHVWDHRRSIAELAEHTNEDELRFSNELIEKNPSNYSAWHYRGTLLPKVRPDETENAEYKMPISEECLKDELDKTLNICCLNSEDQTAWTYCRWLCEAACDKAACFGKPPCRRSEARTALENVVSVCEELIKIEDDNPWQVIVLARTKILLDGHTTETLEQVKFLFNKVKKLDPQRSGMYEDLFKKYCESANNPSL